MISFPPPCDMSKAMVYCTWQGHLDRPGYKGEPGVDLASYGEAKIDLTTVMDGKVTRDKDSGYNDGFGIYNEIDHGVRADGRHYKTLCAHMDSNTVKVGQTVKAGEKIGVMGETGNTTGVHTHFILWVNGKNVDPEPYFNYNSGVDMKPVIPAITPGLRVRVTCGGLYVRSGPAKTNKSVDLVAGGYEAQVFEVKDLGQEIWVRISEKEQKWLALYYQGDVNATFFTVTVVNPVKDVVAKLEKVVADFKTTGDDIVTISTGDLQDLLQLYREK